MVEDIDRNSITFEDLQDEYQKLKERYSQLVIINDEDTQRIHELRRNLDTANAAEAYLAQELEQIALLQASQDDAILQKKQNEVDELKKRQNSLLTENEDLQQDIADLRVANEKLHQQIKELTLASQPTEISIQIPADHLELREKLEVENLELLAKLDETYERINKFTMSMAEKDKQIEILKDQVLCLEENLQSKREEVDEKSHLLEGAQEQVVEMNAKVALLTSCPDNADRKGNSLFAEVDDQRQAMKQLLATQKKNYTEMKRVYNESQYEIRRLRRENTAMHIELKACSTIFLRADKTYKEKLNERIEQLLKQNEDLEKKLVVTENELVSLANDKGVAWLDSMLLFCKQETEQLKKELQSNRIQKRLLEDQLRNSQQDLAKWRFEALKTRSVIIDREGLLTENKIEFKKFTRKDVSFTSNEIENAKPDIGFGNRQWNTKNDIGAKPEIVKSECKNESVIAIEADENQPGENKEEQEMHPFEPSAKVKINLSESVEFPAIKIEKCNRQSDENGDDRRFKETSVIVKTEFPTSPIGITICQPNEPKIKIKSTNSTDQDVNILRINAEPKSEENKENSCASHFETNSTSELCAKNVQGTNSNKSNEFINDLRPSILVTKRNILGDESNMKSVHFGAAVKSEQSEPKLKSIRTKSNVIVKRFVISSRNKSEAIVPPNPQ